MRIAPPESEWHKLEVRRVQNDAYMTVPPEELEEVKEHGRKFLRARRKLSGNWMIGY